MRSHANKQDFKRNEDQMSYGQDTDGLSAASFDPFVYAIKVVVCS